MEVDYVQALKDHVGQWSIDHLKKVGNQVDEEFCCKHHGIPTWHLRSKLGYPTSTHRNALKKLEKQGVVRSYKQQENQILWWPVGFLEEILAKNT